jgi:hypothetical protein
VNKGFESNQAKAKINEKKNPGGNMNAGNINNAISSTQKLVSKEKATLDKINTQYLRVIDKNQNLDIIKQSLES